MSKNQLFILIAIGALALIAGLLIYSRSQRKETTVLTPLTALAFGCIVAGIVFGEERWLGYSLMGLGVILSIVDVIIKIKKRN
jgi:drug/metabolite transporter (DMT)-like permease